MVTRMALGWALATALLMPGTAGAAFDAAADFSATLNPAGRWTYGWTEQLGSAFIIDALAGKTDGLDYWSGPVTEQSPPGHFPLVAHNGTDQVLIAAFRRTVVFVVFAGAALAVTVTVAVAVARVGAGGRGR